MKSGDKLPRRTVLRGAVAAFAAGCAAPVVRTPPEELAQFPLTDAHSHYVSKAVVGFGYTVEDLLRAMTTAGIRRLVVVGFGEEIAGFARTHPDRLVASYGGPTSFRTRQARGEIKDGTLPAEVERIGAEFEAALRSGAYRGLGEIHTYARPIPAGVTGGSAVAGSTISPDSPLVLLLLELAGRHGVPVNIHCDDYGARAMASALRAHRRTAVVWAHAGSWLSPSSIRELLQEHPNVSFDLSAKNPACCPGGLANYPLLGVRALDGDWRQLFETYPDRFLVGIDFFSSAHLRSAREAGEFYRAILTQLTPATARKIGYENAERAYGLRA